ncbi:MAG TPA: hypothetical protein VK524_10130, partial [Polyangiaceae bacterium]|nr:hypothetical protein [Polyangiaceae bacterium]
MERSVYGAKIKSVALPSQPATRRKGRRLLGVFALALTAACGVALWKTSGHSRDAIVSARAAEEPHVRNATRSHAEEVHPARAAAAVAAVENSEPAQTEPDNPHTPSEVEVGGRLTYLYEAWREASPDSVGTERAKQLLEQAFVRYQIHPNEQHTACQGNLCRSEFAFDDLNEMRSLGRIPPDVVANYNFGDPEPRADGRLGVVVYWTQGGMPLPEPPVLDQRPPVGPRGPVM